MGKWLIFFISLIPFLISCGGGNKNDNLKKESEKKEKIVEEKEKKMSDDEVLELLNKKIDKSKIVLANPEQIYYKPAEKYWKVKDFKFSVYELAYDHKKGILVGMSKDQKYVKGINVKTGKQIWKRKLDLTKPEKLDKEEAEEEKTEYITLQDTDPGRDNSRPSFAYDGKKIVIAAVNKRDKKKKWLYNVHYYGIDINNGRIKWKKTLKPNPWKNSGWTLWNQKGVFYLGNPDNGPLYIIDQKDGEWYDIRYPKEEGLSYTFAGTDDKYTFYIKSGSSVGFNVVGLDREDGSKLWEKAYPCRLRRAFYMGKEINDHTFLCSKQPEQGKNTFKHIDALIKFNPKDGSIIFTSVIEERTPNQNITKDMIYKILSSDKKSYYIRSLFYFAKVDAKTGRVVWKTKLNPTKIDGIFIDNKFSRHQWVLGGDEAYDKYIKLNEADGSILWTASVPKSKNNSNPGMPATAKVVDNWILSFGDNVIKIFDLKDGKQIWKHKTKDKIESIYLSNGILYLETQGIRKGFKVPTFEIWSIDRTKNETLLNDGWMKNLGDLLMLYNEDDHLIVRQKAIKKTRRYKIDKNKLSHGEVLTTQGRFNSLQFSNDGKKIYFSNSDRDLTKKFKIDIGTKKIEKLEPTEQYGYEVITKNGRKKLLQHDGKKLKSKKVLQYFLKDKDGKEIQLSDNELEFYKFSDDGKKIFIVIADNQHFHDEVDYKDLIFKVYDIENSKFHHFFTIKKAIGAIRGGSIKETMVRYGDFGPDGTLSFTIENMHAHKGIYTMKYDVKKPLEIDIEIDMDEDEIVNYNIPKGINLIPTDGLEFQEVDFNHSFYNSLNWSTDSRLAVGEYFGLKYSTPEIIKSQKKVRNKEKIDYFDQFPHLVTTYDWHPKGKYLALNSGGNIYILNTKDNSLQQITHFIPKREPKNMDDTQMGNKYRIKSLSFSPDGKKLAISLKLYNEPLRRIVIVDIERYIK